MIVGLAAPSAPHFTPQRGAPQLPHERLAPKHPGGQFSFWRSLAGKAAGSWGWSPPPNCLAGNAAEARAAGGLSTGCADRIAWGAAPWRHRCGWVFASCLPALPAAPAPGSKMRISLCNEVVRDLSFEHQCAFARALGYDGLEIA